MKKNRSFENSGCDRQGNSPNEITVENNKVESGLQDFIGDLLIEPAVQEKDSASLESVANEDVTKIQQLKTKENDATYSKDNPILNPNKSISNEPETAYKTFLEPDPRLEKVSKLLEKIVELPLAVETSELTIEEATVKNSAEVKSVTIVEIEKEKQALIQTTNDNSFVQRDDLSLRHSLEDNFQTLIFDVNSLPLAVPLIKLGGIVNVGEQPITPLVGTPDWFLGLIPNERGNLMVVDTQRFLMPERPILDDRSYDYLIILDNSQWALACHNVGDAKNMNASDIRWSNKSSKRPWFAGMVVEYMSALIEVDSLINLLAEQIVD